MVAATHVTAVIRDDATRPATFRLYDNDTNERARGTFRRVTTRELWSNICLAAIMSTRCTLYQYRAVKALPRISEHVSLISPENSPAQPDRRRALTCA